MIKIFKIKLFSTSKKVCKGKVYIMYIKVQISQYIQKLIVYNYSKIIIILYVVYTSKKCVKEGSILGT